MTFQTYHPLTVIFYYSAWLTMAVLTKHPLVVLLVLLLTCIHFRMRTPRKEASTFILYDVCVVLLIVIASAAFKHNGVTPLFFWNDQAVTQEVLFWAVSVGLLYCAVHLMYVNAVHHLATDRFLFACRLLSPALSFFLAQCLYFIPTCQQRLKAMHRAQKSIGFYATASYVDRLLGWMKVLFESLTWAFERSFQKNDAMRARGYHLKGKTVFQLYRFHVRDGVVIGMTVAYIVLFCSQYGGTAFDYFPETKDVHLSAIAGWSVAICGLLPIAIDVKERWKWHYYNSKM